jgi:DNA topoisomerase VI subunit B
VQDNGPGIVKKQIPLIFGKLLYGSKFHRLRMSRGQQGIGISAAGMYGMLTTGKPVKIISKTLARKPAHYYEIQIDTKKNRPGDPQRQGRRRRYSAQRRGRQVHRESTASSGWRLRSRGGKAAQPVKSGTRVTIELEAAYQRGRGSVDEYLEQTAIANPHVTLHYIDPEGNRKSTAARRLSCPPSPRRSSRIPTASNWAGW